MHRGGANKELTPEEVSFICGENKKIVPIFQWSADEPHYFTVTQATSDANNAINRAEYLGQPGGKPIYFAVDFAPSTEAHFTMIMNYFGRLNQIFSSQELNPDGYLLGVYGCSTVCKRLKTTYPSVYSWLWGTQNCYDNTYYTSWNLKQHSEVTIGTGASKFKICPDTSSSNGTGGWNI